MITVELSGMVALSAESEESNQLWEGFLAKVTFNQDLSRGFPSEKGREGILGSGNNMCRSIQL